MEESGDLEFPLAPIPKSDEQINELQEQIQDGKDRNGELLFALILVVVIFIDFLIFRELDTVVGISFICFLETIGLLILCKRLGIEEPYVYLVALLKRITQNFGKDS